MLRDRALGTNWFVGCDFPGRILSVPVNLPFSPDFSWD